DPATEDAARESSSAWHEVAAGVAVVDLSIPPEEQPVALGAVRLFSGYAGWDAEQLEGEIDEGAWFILDPVHEDMLGATPEQLWHDVLQRQGGRLAMLATYPPTPTVN
ncbi:MAG TPA: YqgE/AlgH family protein, partial [Acidimicrobiales bacterium]|nr:YqgE/AlgH family protein [Acidimicrobiales bacterium]